MSESSFSYKPITFWWLLGYLCWVVFTETTFDLTIFVIPLIVLGIVDIFLMYLGTKTFTQSGHNDDEVDSE